MIVDENHPLLKQWLLGFNTFWFCANLRAFYVFDSLFPSEFSIISMAQR